MRRGVRSNSVWGDPAFEHERRAVVWNSELPDEFDDRAVERGPAHASAQCGRSVLGYSRFEELVEEVEAHETSVCPPRCLGGLLEQISKGVDGETRKFPDLGGTKGGGLMYVRVELFFESSGGVVPTGGELEGALIKAGE